MNFDSGIIFDPNVLTEEEKNYLDYKITKYTGPVDADGCEKFTPKTRAGKNETIGSLSLDKDISLKYYQMKQKKLNPAALALSLDSNLPIYKSMECSHLCGFGLCMNSSHIRFEPKNINNDRIICHKNKLCGGHQSENNEYHYDACIIKTVKAVYAFENSL